jgi:hypothetical protein
LFQVTDSGEAVPVPARTRNRSVCLPFTFIDKGKQ